MKVAILGATGAVGRTMLLVLESRMPEVEAIVPLASERSAGQTLRWRGRNWIVRPPEPGVFAGSRVALFSAGAALSRTWAPRAVEEGAVVIDNSSAWRLDPEVPLVVPEVNAARVAERPRGIIANPNCTTIQIVLPLEALRRVAGLERVDVASYQSVSGAGQTGLDALREELAGRAADDSPFPAAIAGNVIAQIGALRDDGWTAEEWKIREESRKILDGAELRITATCVRVPVEVGHAVAGTVRTTRPVSLEEARDAIRRMPGACLADEGRVPTPRAAAGTDDVRVGRIRVDPDEPRILHLWIVADNLRKGAATNAVQIAECLSRDGSFS